MNDSNKTNRFDQLETVIGDGPQVDSYGRHRVTSPDIQYALQFSATNHSLLTKTAVTGSATTAFNSTLGSVRLTCTTSSSDSAIVQSNRYLQYNPGASYFMGISGVIGAKKNNVRQRWGYFDDLDGLFFEQTGTELAVVRRTSISGSPVDTRVLQGSWNIDKLNGTGISEVTLDTSKHNLYVIDYVWQGAGRIRFGVVINGEVIYVHEIAGSNTLTGPFMKNPSKPLRVELTNTGTAATTTTLDLVCLSAVREAVTEIFAPYTFSASRGVTTKSINAATMLPLLSIRPALTFNGLTNRVPILPIEMEVFTIQDSLYVQVVLNPTLTAASWASVGSNSATERDIAATALTGGTVIFETFVPGGGKGNSSFGDLQDVLLLGLNIAASTADILTIAAAKIGGNSDTTAKIRFQEFQ